MDGAMGYAKEGKKGEKKVEGDVKEGGLWKAKIG